MHAAFGCECGQLPVAGCVWNYPAHRRRGRRETNWPFEIVSTVFPSRSQIADWADLQLRRAVNGTRAAFERWVARNSPVGSEEIISPAAFPWVAELEANWETIRRELDGVLETRTSLPSMQLLSPTQYLVTKENVWKAFVFSAFGVRSEDNCRRCPETARLIDRIPNLELAFFSVLEPGAHLRAHRGVYKGLIRAHLGLLVPEPRTRVRMQVGSRLVHWEEGRCVLFDDTYVHEVWNDTGSVRVVLLIDVHRPLRPPLASINEWILRAVRFLPFVTNATRQLRAWEKSHYGPDAAMPPKA